MKELVEKINAAWAVFAENADKNLEGKQGCRRTRTQGFTRTGETLQGIPQGFGRSRKIVKQKRNVRKAGREASLKLH